MKVNTNKGYMTIEASVIVPVILLATMLMIVGLVLTYEKARLLSNEYKALYTIPLDDIRGDNVQGYLGGKNYSDGIAYGSSSADVSYEGHRAKCDGTVELLGTVSADGDHEIDVLSDRLRRWQLYDSLAEK